MIWLIFILAIIVIGYFYTKNSKKVVDIGQPQSSKLPVSPTESPVSPTESPVSPTEPPVSPTEPPVSPTEPPVSPTEPKCIIGDWTECPIEGGGYRTRNISSDGSCDNNIQTTQECGSYIFNSLGYCNCISGTMNGEYKCQLSDGTESQLCSKNPPTNPICEGTPSQLQEKCRVGFDIRLIPNSTSVIVITKVRNVKDTSIILQRRGIVIEQQKLESKTTFNNLMSGTDYVVYVRGIHTLSGQTVSSEPMEFKTVLPVPSNFTATRQSDNKILFSWNAVSGATKYTIYLGKPNLQDYELITTDTTTYLLDPSAVVPKLGVNSAYYFWIQSVGDGIDNMSWLSDSLLVPGAGGQSNSYDWRCDNGVLRCYKDYIPVDKDYENYTPVSKNCGDVPVIPFNLSCLNKNAIPPPTNFTAIKTGSSVKLSWNISNIVNIGGVGGYVIYNTKNNEPQESASARYVYYTATEIDLPFSLIGAKNGDRLSFYIVTRSGGGEGPKSPVVIVTI
jgi:hypothetical protein